MADGPSTEASSLFFTSPLLGRNLAATMVWSPEVHCDWTERKRKSEALLGHASNVFQRTCLESPQPLVSNELSERKSGKQKTIKITPFLFPTLENFPTLPFVKVRLWPLHGGPLPLLEGNAPDYVGHWEWSMGRSSWSPGPSPQAETFQVALFLSFRSAGQLYSTAKKHQCPRSYLMVAFWA